MFHRFYVSLLILFQTFHAMAAFAADERFLSPQERRALGAVFDEVQVLDSPLSVLQRAAGLKPEQRFQFLAQWVLPGDSHDTLRMAVGFLPTGFPSDLQTDSETALASANTARQPAGGTIVSPAAELIRLAGQLDRLDEVLRRLETAPSTTTDQQIARLAGLILANCTSGQLGTAKNQMAHLYQIVAAHQEIRSSWKGPLLLAIQAGSQADATAAAARDLAFDIAQTEIDNISPSQWRSFHRHIMLMAEQCVVQLSNRPAEQRAMAAANPTAAEDEATTEQALRDIRSADGGLTQWQSSTLYTSFSSASGGPNDVWHWDGESISKASGHRKDYLYFQSPLRGNYEIEFDASASTWLNTHVMIGGHWTGTGSQERYMFGTLGDPGYTYQELSPPMAKFRTAMHYRAVVRGTSVSFFGNGRLLRTVELSEDHDPWVAFGRIVKNTIRISNVRITGEPVIPDSIRLSASRDLTGWIPYYNESIGGTPAQGRRWRQEGEPKNGGIVSCSANPWLEPGMFGESMAYYHRPMLEDGTIEYEFRYDEDRFHTHPALGRTVFLLQRDGVRIHQLTNRFLEQRELSPGNESVTPEHQKGPKQLPLRPGEWNALKFRVTGDTLNLYLNGEHIYQHPIAGHNPRNFGLFHYSDQSRVYARNIVWHGSWPKKLPSLVEQELVGHDTDFLDDTRDQLPAAFSHTFAEDYLPENEFRNRSPKPDDVSPGPLGVTITRTGSSDGYETSVVETQLGAGGDFDISVSFDSFQTDLDPNDGNGNIYLQVALDDEHATELHVRRRHVCYKDREIDHNLAYADYVERRPDETRRDCVGYTSTECVAGTLRIARRDSTIYFLFAEADSADFRILSTMKSSTGDIRVGGVRMRVLTYRGSMTSVRFRRLNIRADKLFGPATVPPPAQELVAELDQKRSALPVGQKFDFAKQSAVNSSFAVTSGVLPWRPDAGGQEFVHTGTARWSASSAILRDGLEGDFDITATFELQKVVNPEAGRESGIYLKTKFGDELRHQPEVMFRRRGTDHTEVEARIGRQPPGRGSEWQRVRGVRCEGAMSMRIARYGTTAYYLTRLAPDQPEVLIATLEVPTEPIHEHGIWLMVSALGEGRETHGMFKTLEVRATRMVKSPQPQIENRRPSPSSPPTPPTKSLLRSLFDAF